jgi:neutral trehalase
VYGRSLAAEYAQRAERRIGSIKRFMWDGEDGLFTDYLWRKGQTTRNVTAATRYLLFLNIAFSVQ